jgi:hypothetical protein
MQHLVYILLVLSLNHFQLELPIRWPYNGSGHPPDRQIAKIVRNCTSPWSSIAVSRQGNSKQSGLWSR